MGIATIYKSVDGKNKIQEAYEDYLEAFSLRLERAYVKTRFGNTHLLITGPKNAKPLIILQGGNAINPMTLYWFKELFHHYRIYAPDRIGHPGYSDETRISAKDHSFANWISDIMDWFQLEKSAFIGPSYGAGIILRLATFQPERIACAVLINPSGIQLGSKKDMLRHVILPLVSYHRNRSEASLTTITNALSAGVMTDQDRQLIGNIFSHVKLEKNMPKLTTRKELRNYHSPTMVITGERDIFFPNRRVMKYAQQIIPNLISYHTFDMGHFPSTSNLEQIQTEIYTFLQEQY
ncbi:alpha/beta hydrolase [Virgibacillus sp. AGTR]|uniref:alpha/beta fold hydrolase n=1 Tax=Virgibacillus sp. AGTR TaxID=2812055 RepID=UPI001966C4E9|nr:alpha/beta hydrolase [Virgibacillus sp. AGTR]MCC2250741.1 alpha/beta hydrolase [Virgibacillus sp. AGTR]QRZ18083.1 alpha/beta fold hydrolase [Virgibacillus sp. AGTR]